MPNELDKARERVAAARDAVALCKRLRALIDSDDVHALDMDKGGTFWTELADIDHELHRIGVLSDAQM